MILSLVCLTALQAATAGDFFPAVPGTVRTYEQKGGGGILINTVGKLLDMGGASVIPITESPGSGAGSTTYYRVEPDQVSIVAYDITKPMKDAMPVLRLGSGTVKWDYQGATQFKGGETLRAHGEAHLAGQRTVLGKKVDILVVKLAAALGSGLAGETFDQTTVYGKGFGMIEQTTKNRLGRRTIEVAYRLVGFEAGK